MTWRQTDDKPIPELTLTQFTDAYMRHYGEMSERVSMMLNDTADKI